MKDREICRCILENSIFTCLLVCVDHLQRDPQKPQLLLGTVTVWSEAEAGENTSTIQPLLHPKQVTIQK